MLTRAYVRRKRFEARLIAQEVGTLFGDSDTSSSASSRPASAPATVPPSVLLKTMGIELP